MPTHDICLADVFSNLKSCITALAWQIYTSAPLFSLCEVHLFSVRSKQQFVFWSAGCVSTSAFGRQVDVHVQLH